MNNKGVFTLTIVARVCWRKVDHNSLQNNEPTMDEDAILNKIVN
jgi:hypothetical protein